jgi:hypothetical protein
MSQSELAALRAALEEARERIRWLEAALVPQAPPQRAELPLNRSCEIVLLALKASSWPLNHEALGRRLDVGLNRDGSVNPKFVDVIICRLRKKLRALTPPVAIQTASKRGWWMDAKNKALLQAFYDGG